MSEVCSVDIGDSLATAQSLQEKLQKLGTKVEVSGKSEVTVSMSSLSLSLNL